MTDVVSAESLRTAAEVELRGLSAIHEDVMVEYVHSGLERLPGYMELYAKYLKQRWDVFDLDFAQDRYDWMERLTDPEREALTIAAGRFMHGERAVEVTLAPLLVGGLEEQRIFLTSQIEDEARHAVFFDRFRSEVLGVASDSLTAALGETYDDYHFGGEAIFSHALLAQLGHRLWNDPHNARDRMRYATVYFFWAEGVRALTTFKVLMHYCRERNVLPGFYTGIIAVTRDESRHVQFGMRLMHDAIQADPTLAGDVHETLRTLLRINTSASLEAFDANVLGWSPEQIRATMITNIQRKLACIGLRLPADLQAMTATVAPGVGE